MLWCWPAGCTRVAGGQQAGAVCIVCSGTNAAWRGVQLLVMFVLSFDEACWVFAKQRLYISFVLLSGTSPVVLLMASGRPPACAAAACWSSWLGGKSLPGPHKWYVPCCYRLCCTAVLQATLLVSHKRGVVLWVAVPGARQSVQPGCSSPSWLIIMLVYGMKRHCFNTHLAC